MLPRHDWFPPLDPPLIQIRDSAGLDALASLPLPLDGGEVALHTQRLRQWLGEGKHGAMAWLERNAPISLDPRSLMPEARTVLVALANYHGGHASRVALPPDHGRVANYAWGRDYHKVFLKQLQATARALDEAFPGSRHRAFTDADPLHERHLARMAGLGFTGRHTLLITSGFGSKVFIGVILSSVEFGPSVPIVPDRPHGACPSSCRTCIVRCPTGALADDGTIDARRCISYLTIESPDPIPQEYFALDTDWVFGCDVCQDVCPFQLRVKPARHHEYQGRSGPGLPLGLLLDLRGHDDMVRHFSGTPLMRAGRDRMVRNALVVVASRRLTDFLPRVRDLVHDSSPLVATQARMVLDWLLQSPANSLVKGLTSQ